MDTENKYIFSKYRGTIYVFVVLKNEEECRYMGKVHTLYSKIDNNKPEVLKFKMGEKDRTEMFTPSEFYEY